MKKKIRQAFFLAHYQYLEWMLNGKQIIVLIIVFFMMRYITKPLILLSSKVNAPLQWTEGILATFNSIYLIPIIIFCFLTLISEFHVKDSTSINLLFRMEKSSWYGGQLLFCCHVCVTFLAELLLFYLMGNSERVYVENGWSPIMRHYLERYQETGRANGVIAVVPGEVFNHFSPDEALFYTLLLFFGLFLQMAFITLVAELSGKKMMGILINLLLTFTGTVMIYLKSDIRQLLPLGNAVLRSQNMPVTKLTEWYEPFLYFIICNVILIIIGRKQVSRMKL